MHGKNRKKAKKYYSKNKHRISFLMLAVVWTLVFSAATIILLVESIGLKILAIWMVVFAMILMNKYSK